MELVLVCVLTFNERSHFKKCGSLVYFCQYIAFCEIVNSWEDRGEWKTPNLIALKSSEFPYPSAKDCFWDAVFVVSHPSSHCKSVLLHWWVRSCRFEYLGMNNCQDCQSIQMGLTWNSKINARLLKMALSPGRVHCQLSIHFKDHRQLFRESFASFLQCRMAHC